MRLVVVAALLAASCRFAPDGGDLHADDVVPPADDARGDGGGVAADARALDASGPCPAGYDLVSFGHSFVLRTALASFEDARAACAADDPNGHTHLATFETPGEMDPTIAALVSDGNATMWVGAHCLNDLPCSAMASWFWITQFPVGPGMWTPGQPDANANEIVTRARHDGTTWRLESVVPNLLLPSICECAPP
ncbi:MAG TPA: hypothetical protein VHE35_09285 [Kofleriaceae bacterium]|nr:hypothetical protein [Kofleriaceae bacterium]